MQYRGVTNVVEGAANKPQLAPMHKTVLARQITEDGRLFKDGAPMVVTSTQEFLEKAELRHRFLEELDGRRFEAELAFNRASAFEPREIEKDSAEGQRNDFASLRRRRDSLSRARLRLEKRPEIARLFQDAGQREAAAKILEALAAHLEALAQRGDQ